jgi:hypothetical protein
MNKNKFFILFLILVFAAATWSPALASNPPAAAQTAKLVITNKNPQNVTLRLTGPRSQSIVVPPGKTILQLPPGKYQYSYKVCGAEKTGTLDLRKSGKLNITPCPMAKIKFSNVSGKTMYISLRGPLNYTFTLPPGTSQVRVVKGTYRYSLSGCGGTPTNGTITLKGNIKLFVWCQE